MVKKFILIVILYFAGFFSAMYLLAPADRDRFGENCSRAQALAGKMHDQLCKVIELVNEKASKVGYATIAGIAKR